MQVYTKSWPSSIKLFLFFVVLLFIAFLPVSSFMFFVKNDAFNGYFPPKFFMSESLAAGHLPLWNPYINFGLPQYGDMSSGYWSPITWLVAATVGYNAYSFTIELLAYILIAGWGMYALCKLYQLSLTSCLVAAISFMCCGYISGHLQHFNWVSGAAFLPWAVWGYHRVLTKGSLQHLLAAALLFYLLASSAHPGITIAAIYFFLAYALLEFFKGRPAATGINKPYRAFARTHGLLLLLLGLLSIGMISGYADIIPHMTRGEKPAIGEGIAHPFSFQSWLSFLLPMSTVKNEVFFGTDLSMRNGYIGLCLFSFFLLSLFTVKNSSQRFYLLTGLFFLLLSAGGFFTSLSYKTLPLVGYVRMCGEFALFAVFAFILVAAFSLDAHLKDPSIAGRKLRLVFKILSILLLFAIGFGLLMTFTRQTGILFNWNVIREPVSLAGKLKSLIDAISFYDCLWMQGILQLVLLRGIQQSIYKNHHARLLKFCLADLILATLLNIPFTGAGQASVAQVQAVLDKSPTAIPVPALIPITDHDSISVAASGLVGNWSFYNKQPGVHSFAFYPIELNNTRRVYQQQDLFARPYVFLAGQPGATVQVLKFTGSSTTVTANNGKDDTLVYQQNIYPHWYYKQGDLKKEVLPYRDIFMAAPASPAMETSFVFEPAFVKAMMLVSLLALLSCCILLAWLRIRSASPS